MPLYVNELYNLLMVSHISKKRKNGTIYPVAFITLLWTNRLWIISKITRRYKVLNKLLEGNAKDEIIY